MSDAPVHQHQHQHHHHSHQATGALVSGPLLCLALLGCGDKDDEAVVTLTTSHDLSQLMEGSAFADVQMIARWANPYFQEEPTDLLTAILEGTPLFDDGCKTSIVWQGDNSGATGVGVMTSHVGWVSDSAVVAHYGYIYNLMASEQACGYWPGGTYTNFSHVTLDTKTTDYDPGLYYVARGDYQGIDDSWFELVECPEWSSTTYTSDAYVSSTEIDPQVGGGRALIQATLNSEPGYTQAWHPPADQDPQVWGASICTELGSLATDNQCTDSWTYNDDFHLKTEAYTDLALARYVRLEDTWDLMLPAWSEAHVSLSANVSLSGLMVGASVNVDGSCVGYEWTKRVADTENDYRASTVIYAVVTGWTDGMGGFLVDEYSAAESGSESTGRATAPVFVGLLDEVMTLDIEDYETRSVFWRHPLASPSYLVWDGAGRLVVPDEQGAGSEDPPESTVATAAFPLSRLHLSGDTNTGAGAIRSMVVEDTGTYDAIGITFRDEEGMPMGIKLQTGDSWDASDHLGTGLIADGHYKVQGLMEVVLDDTEVHINHADAPIIELTGIGVEPGALFEVVDAMQGSTTYILDAESMGDLGELLSASGLLYETSALYLSLVEVADGSEGLLFVRMLDGTEVGLPLVGDGMGGWTFEAAVFDVEVSGRLVAADGGIGFYDFEVNGDGMGEMSAGELVLLGNGVGQ